MFMFRSKRSILTKRLLKLRVRRERIENNESQRSPETCCEVSDDNWSGLSNGVDGVGGVVGGAASELEAMVRVGLLKKLKENQLELLVSAVESHGADLSHCVLLAREAVVPGVPQPHVLCCQIWRWPDVRQAGQLKRLPACASANDPVYICCNPYHWSRLCEPESPPPPYSRFAMDTLQPGDQQPTEIHFLCSDRFPGSLTTSGDDANMVQAEWCKLAYWEMANRIGRQYPVQAASVNVFSDLPHGDGLCLATLAQHSFSPPEAVRRTRAKIGHGVILSQEVDGVWAYNLSDAPIFVNSPTLDGTESRMLVVYRVPAGHCLCIFDPVRAANSSFGWHFTEPTGPIDKNSVRISFAKGWGPNYSRQEITACPCWLEVLLAPCR